MCRPADFFCHILLEQPALGEGGANFIFKPSHRSCLVKSIFSTHPSPCLMTSRNTSLTVIASLRPINVHEIMELQSIIFCMSLCSLCVFLFLFFSFLIILQFTIENVSLLQPCSFYSSVGIRYALVTGKSYRWVQGNCCQAQGSTQGLSRYSPLCHWEV